MQFARFSKTMKMFEIIQQFVSQSLVSLIFHIEVYTEFDYLSVCMPMNNVNVSDKPLILKSF